MLIYRMSDYVKRALPLLQVIAKSKPKVRNAIIEHGPADLIKAISEIVLNVLKGVVRLTAAQKKRLVRYKNKLRALASNKVSQKVKEEVSYPERWWSWSLGNTSTYCYRCIIRTTMKRMVLIPEERLLQYERQQRDPVSNIQSAIGMKKRETMYRTVRERKGGSCRTTSLFGEFRRQ